MNSLCIGAFEEIDLMQQESINGGVNWGMLFDGATDVIVGAGEAATTVIAAGATSGLGTVALVPVAIDAGKNLGEGAGKIHNAFS